MKKVVVGRLFGMALLVGPVSGWTAPEHEQGGAHSGHQHMGMMGTHDQQHVESQQETSDTVYVCPMHPEVRKAEPGRCPVCGMNLEAQPVKPTEEDSGHEASGSHQHSEPSAGEAPSSHNHHH